MRNALWVVARLRACLQNHQTADVKIPASHYERDPINDIRNRTGPVVDVGL